MNSHESTPANSANSRPSRKSDQRFTQLAEKMASDATITVNVVDVAKDRNGRTCGLHTKLEGLRAFLPGSRIPRGQDAETLVGKTLEVKLIECDQSTGKLVVSRVAVVQSERAKFVESLVVDQEVTGTVVSVKENLGYFVNIGALDALLHVSQTNVVFEVGDTVTARISQVNLADGKVALSMRMLRSETQRSGNESRQAHKTPPIAPVTPVKAAAAIKPVAQAPAPAVRKAHRPYAGKSTAPAKPSRSSIPIYKSFADLSAALANQVSQ